MKLSTNCSWCDRQIRLSLWAVVFPWLRRKWCEPVGSGGCQYAEELALEVAQDFSDNFLSAIRGECLGSVKCYPNYFQDMISWPSWSPNGEKKEKEKHEL